MCRKEVELFHRFVCFVSRFIEHCLFGRFDTLRGILRKTLVFNRKETKIPKGTSHFAQIYRVDFIFELELRDSGLFVHNTG